MQGLQCDINNNVVAINLQGQPLHGEVPENIVQLNTVTSVVLDATGLTGTIPSSMNNLQHLEVG